MNTKVIGEQQVQILSPNFSISPSNEDYVLNISANGRDFSPLFAVSAGVTRLVSNVAPGSYYKLVGNQSEVVINWQRMCATEGGGSFDPSVLEPYWTSAQTKDYVDGAVSGISVDLSDYYTSAQTEDAIISKNYVTSAQVETQIVSKNYASAEIELPIAAAVNDLKGNIEARLDQQYYKKKEVNDIVARKVEAGQVDAQIKDYVDPAIAEVNDTIADKELPVSAALNELNQKISEISGGSGSDMSAYWTSAQTQTAISSATANMVQSTTIRNIVSISQAEYDAITTKDPSTFYIIVNN